MIWRLLRKNISIGQIAGYAIANLVGLTIVLSAVRFYGDVAPAFASDEEGPLVSTDYLVISKPVSMLNTLTGSTSDFTSKDIETLKSQPWVDDVGAFASADFNVAASVDFAGRSFQTYMFMESIPDAFIDNRPDGWHFEPGVDHVVPIMLSKDYLALYNFGFAASRGLPQLSEDLISQVPITLQLSGNGQTDYFRARIAGFSNRLNTIAVPQDFMEWANSRYNGSGSASPSRLIVKVNKPGDPEINSFMDKHGYEVAGDKLDTGQAAHFLSILTTIVIVIGAIICALALFILMLSIYLLLQKNRQKISDLLMLGYRPSQVSACYHKLVLAVNGSVLVLAIVSMLVVSSMWQRHLELLSLEPSSAVWPVVTGVVIMAVITTVNMIAISRTVKKTFRQ